MIVGAEELIVSVERELQVLDVFSEWKSVYINYSGRLQRAQIDRD